MCTLIVCLMAWLLSRMFHKEMKIFCIYLSVCVCANQEKYVNVSAHFIPPFRFFFTIFRFFLISSHHFLNEYVRVYLSSVDVYVSLSPLLLFSPHSPIFISLSLSSCSILFSHSIISTFSLWNFLFLPQPRAVYSLIQLDSCHMHRLEMLHMHAYTFFFILFIHVKHFSMTHNAICIGNLGQCNVYVCVVALPLLQCVHKSVTNKEHFDAKHISFKFSGVRFRFVLFEFGIFFFHYFATRHFLRCILYHIDDVCSRMLRNDDEKKHS